MSLGMEGTKKRIQSVQSTKKITKAMELVATAKLKTWKDKLIQNSEYTKAMIELANDVLGRVSDGQLESPYIKGNSCGKDLYIVITSNLGLCAGFNYDIYKKVNEYVKPNDKVVIVGLKGFTHYQNIYSNIDTKYIDISNSIEYARVESMANDLLNEYSKGNFDHIYLIYTKYVNSLTFVPELLTLLPVTNFDAKKSTGKDILMEPSPEEILDTLIPLYIKSVLYGKLIESQVSEQASRRTAMETATDNSEELIEKLQLDYNKARQAAITQEITEVVGGAINK